MNQSFFPGMPMRIRLQSSKHDCYLIEYREGHVCPLVLGLGAGIIIYTRLSEVIPDADSEDLSSFNKMVKKKRPADLKGLLAEASDVAKAKQ